MNHKVVKRGELRLKQQGGNTRNLVAKIYKAENEG